jgi:hypothetical protein
MEAIGTLPSFFGTTVHDGFKSYWMYDHARHGLCNKHPCASWGLLVSVTRKTGSKVQ